MVLPWKTRGRQFDSASGHRMIHKLLMSIVKSILNLYNRKSVDANLLFVKEVNNYSNSILGRGYRSIGPEGEVEKLKQFLKYEISNAVDAGANNGRYSESLLQTFNVKNLYLFEPSSTCYKTLTSKFNKMENIHIINKGLSENTEIKTFYGEFDGDEGSSIYNRNLNYLNIEFVELGNIDLIKFDTFWEEEINKEIIDLFKLDIEGNELSALKGSIQALESTRVVQFEFGGTSIDARNFFKDYFFFFKELNFELFRMRPNSLIKITQYAEEEENFTHSNFLAVNSKYL